ncbi:MAG TPA: FmdB family zinc ribbon protein [Candidatus Heimdallarchaeota archaeon]|nr:FmdB family zinc ribbon protein [Candidatus Heimdallarchaeota archaeon]
MPLYRYECDDCGAVFKKLQMNGNSPRISCPECGSQTTHRLVPRVGVVYKGSGFHATDYRKKPRTSSTSEEEPSSSSSSSSSDSDDK